MTELNLTEAISAANDALHARHHWSEVASGDARSAVEAAAPIIVRKVAERIAAEIENELVCCDGENTHGGGICYWGSRAAKLAREIGNA